MVERASTFDGVMAINLCETFKHKTRLLFYKTSIHSALYYYYWQYTFVKKYNGVFVHLLRQIMQKDIALPKYIFQKAELILAQLQIYMYQ